MRSVKRKLKKTKKDVSKISKSSPGYSAFYDVRTGEKHEINNTKFKAKSTKSSGSTFTVKSLKQKVENVKEMQKSFKKEVKQKIKFTINQITNKVTNRSSYAAIQESCESPINAHNYKNLSSAANDNECYNTPSKPNHQTEFMLTRSQLRKRKASNSSTTNNFTSALQSLKQDQQSMDKVIEKQKCSKLFMTPVTRRRLQMPQAATPTPVKMARLATGLDRVAIATPVRRTPRRKSRVPRSILDSQNRRKVIRRASSRICGLLGVGNPIAYQLKTNI